VNEPSTPRPEQTSDDGVPGTPPGSERASNPEGDGGQRNGPTVDLRTGDPSPSGAQPDAEVEDTDVQDDHTANATSSSASYAFGGSGTAEGSDAADADAHEAPGVDLESLAAADPRSKAELIGAVLDLEADRDEYLDDLRRARAEFENYRRRVTREAAGQRKAGTAEAVEALLEVLDDLDRTLEAAEDSSDDRLAKGVELVASKLARALQSFGVERVDAEGVPFDPNLHEAVQQQPADEPTPQPIVAQVLRPGYRLEDRVLRAAMVVVEG